MASEIVDRVAKKLHDESGLTVNIKAYWEGQARAAIEAMRVPTGEMVENAMAPYVCGNDETMNNAFRITIAAYWQAMIDQALKD